jgi:hypothetical protein
MVAKDMKSRTTTAERTAGASCRMCHNAAGVIRAREMREVMPCMMSMMAGLCWSPKGNQAKRRHC